MLERQYTSDRLNEIANHPSVYPWIKGEKTDSFDLTHITSSLDHVCLLGEHGSVIFIKHQPGIYEFHTSVLPEGRGGWMVEGSKFAFEYMFLRTDAFELLTKCPHGNVAASAGARAVGCNNLFTTRPLWKFGKRIVPIDIYSIILQNWIKNADNLVEVGKSFHKLLDLEYTRLGKIISVHDEDSTHDRYVGATVEMIRNGQIMKAVNFYNRWSKMSGYKDISIVSLSPLVIDIFDCKLKVLENSFEVI